VAARFQGDFNAVFVDGASMGVEMLSLVGDLSRRRSALAHGLAGP
jgi:hypothetical protein